MTTLSQEPDQPVASPCVRNCCLDDHDVCLGCGRSIAEIVGWNSATRNEKLEIIFRSKSRLIELRAQSDWGSAAR